MRREKLYKIRSSFIIQWDEEDDDNDNDDESSDIWVTYSGS